MLTLVLVALGRYVIAPIIVSTTMIVINNYIKGVANAQPNAQSN